MNKGALRVASKHVHRARNREPDSHTLMLGSASLSFLATPEMVPPVPAPHTIMSRRPSHWWSISSAVPS